MVWVTRILTSAHYGLGFLSVVTGLADVRSLSDFRALARHWSRSLSAVIVLHAASLGAFESAALSGPAIPILLLSAAARPGAYSVCGLFGEVALIGTVALAPAAGADDGCADTALIIAAVAAPITAILYEIMAMLL